MQGFCAVCAKRLARAAMCWSVDLVWNGRNLRHLRAVLEVFTDMTAVFIASTDIIIDGLFKFQHDRHVLDYRMHLKMFAVDPNYMDEMEARRAAKRAAGIGPEGMCPR